MLAADTRNRRTAGNNGFQIAPTATNSAAMLFNQFFKTDRHGLFNNAWVVHMPRNREQFCSRIIGPPKTAKPVRASAQNSWNNRDRFHVIHRRRAPIKPGTCREWRLHPRHSFFAFKAFQEGSFFTANISARAMMQIKIKIPTRLGGILAKQARIIGFVDRRLQRFALANILSADVNVTRVGIHRKTGDQTTLD